MPAMAALRCALLTISPESRASPLPHGRPSACGSGLARDGIGAKYLTDLVACIAGKPAPTDVVVPSKPDAGLILCGSGLARDGVAAVYLTDRGACIAGKPTPTKN